MTGPATEEHPLGAHTLPYAMHKMECDKVVQQRAPALRGCSAYMLRPHIFAGASVENYMVGAFRGTPGGRSDRAARMRSRGKRLPCLLPSGTRYLENRIQFVHVDDMARLITRILEKTEPEAQRLTILNVAGRGEPLTFERCIEIAQARLLRLPGKAAFRLALKALWQLGIVAIPPEAAPYMTGEYIMNTDRLRKFLGENYEDVIRYTIADAFADCFKSETAVKAEPSRGRGLDWTSAFGCEGETPSRQPAGRRRYLNYFFRGIGRRCPGCMGSRTDSRKPVCADALQHFVGGGKARHRCGQIGVRPFHP